jgi:cellulose synthase operon protein C
VRKLIPFLPGTGRGTAAEGGGGGAAPQARWRNPGGNRALVAPTGGWRRRPLHHVLRTWSPSPFRGGFFLLALLLAACAAPSPQQSYETAREAYQNGRTREARIAVLNALQADPMNGAARLLQARLFLDARDGVAAEAEISRAMQSGVSPAETRHLLAHARLLQNDPGGARRLAGQAPAAHRAYAERVAGLALIAEGDPRAGMLAFDRALAADPNDSDTWLEIARFRRSIGDLQPALTAVDHAVAANPQDADALILRGELSRGQYGLAAAIPWFDRALEVDPGNVTALLERAVTNGDLGRARAMLDDSRTVALLAPDHPLPPFLQATLAARAGMYDLARTLLRRTRGAYDSNPSGMLLSAVLLYEAQDYDGAARRLEQLVERQPGNLKARRLLAAARWRLNDAAGAIDALRSIADRPDADTYVLSLAADVLQSRGEAQAAQLYRARAARPRPAAAWLWSQHSRPEVAAIGQLLVAGNGAEALARARALQASVPGSPDVHLVAGDVLSALRDHRAAAEAYARAANLAFTEAAALRLVGALRRAGDPARAGQVLRLFAAQNPRNVSAQLLLAADALQAGRSDEAIARYEALRGRLGNGDAALLANLAWAYGAAGETDRAVLFARRAWLLAPANPASADALGWALYREGRTAEALSLLLAVRRGQPESALLNQQQVAQR